MSKDRDDFTSRTLLALATAQADRANLDKQIATMIEALAKEHGVHLLQEAA